MDVFVSWSGSRSKAFATAYSDWLPNILQSVVPWVSSEDIDSGTRWSTGIATALESIDMGVLCLTEDNLNAPWLLFEAGAVSKAVDSARVVPYLLGVSPAQLVGPLAQFQARRV
jgi:hypothetical protein